MYKSVAEWVWFCAATGALAFGAPLSAQTLDLLTAVGEPKLVETPISEFVAARQARIAALAASSGEERTAAKIELASFFLSHGLGREARAALPDLTGSTDANARASEVASLHAALDLIEGKAIANVEVLDMLEFPALWRALARIHGEADRPDVAAIEAAKAILERQSDGLQERLWPVLLTAALDLGPDALSLSEELSIAAHDAGLSETQSHYFTGRLALLAGHPEQAEMFWLAASDGFTSHAARARLALGELWMARPNPSYADARAMLEKHLFSWRGDELELEHLILLARLYEETGALPEAVSIMGRILHRFPESAAADLAIRRAEALLPRLYTAGFDGELEFAAFLDHHALNRRLYDGHEVFMPAWVEMAHWLREMGASDAAALEFESLAASGGATADLDRAAALLDGGQVEAAWDTLIDHNRSDTSEQIWRNLANQAAALLETPPATTPPLPKSPTVDTLRDHAQAGRLRGDSPTVADTLMSLTQEHSDAIRETDAVNLLLAAQNTNQPERATLAATLLEEGAATRDLAETILAPDRDFSTLSRTDTSAQLGQTEAILEAASALLALPDAADVDAPAGENVSHSSEVENSNPEQTDATN